MAWSNLMKIGRYEGGNPNNYEYHAQIDGCVRLFYQELEEIQPEIVILLTGAGWCDEFTKALNLAPSKSPFIIGSGAFNQSRIVVTERPRFGNNEEAVRQILEAI